ncbi:MAG: winged helix-turn-helix domain-containing protein [Rhodomicrobiaceae bacterium]
MPRSAKTPIRITPSDARCIWLSAQQLDMASPFGNGPDATRLAIEHLGYVQIDTINVIERCHHHILYSRIPDYKRADLHQAQSSGKTVFEYWTHALSYVPTKDIRIFLRAMKEYRKTPSRWYHSVASKDLRKVLKLIRDNGPLSIRDIDDDVLVEKDHPWASRKPSKRALQLAFMTGDVTISARIGMLRSYDLFDRHFGWEAMPKPATERQVDQYLLERALRSQGIVSLDSICYSDAKRKAAIRKLIDSAVRRKELLPVTFEGAGNIEHWAAPGLLDTVPEPSESLVHILSPFDPLIIQRNRLKLFFGYDHRFEAYVPKEKRVLGYFALPVLVGEEIVAAIDLKTDRQARKLTVQKWTWIGGKSSRSCKPQIEEELHRFERFQLGP